MKRCVNPCEEGSAETDMSEDAANTATPKDFGREVDDLITFLDAAYGDGHMAYSYEDFKAGRPADDLGDGLARFLVLELLSVIDRSQPLSEQWDVLEGALETAISDIDKVLSALQDMAEINPPGRATQGLAHE